MSAEVLRRIAADPSLLEVARLAIEDILIEFRDERISLPGRKNGLIVRERDGSESSVVRLGPEDAVRIGLKAISDELDRREGLE